MRCAQRPLFLSFPAIYRGQTNSPLALVRVFFCSPRPAFLSMSDTSWIGTLELLQSTVLAQGKTVPFARGFFLQNPRVQVFPLKYNPDRPQTLQRTIDRNLFSRMVCAGFNSPRPPQSGNLVLCAVAQRTAGCPFRPAACRAVPFFICRYSHGGLHSLPSINVQNENSAHDCQHHI